MKLVEHRHPNDMILWGNHIPLCFIFYHSFLTGTSLFEFVEALIGDWSSDFSGDSSPICSSWRHFILLFWNQTLTWLSERPNMDASWCRSPLVRYFWTWKRFSRPLRWRFENTARVQGLRGLRCFTWEYKELCGSTKATPRKKVRIISHVILGFNIHPVKAHEYSSVCAWSWHIHLQRIL